MEQKELIKQLQKKLKDLDNWFYNNGQGLGNRNMQEWEKKTEEVHEIYRKLFQLTGDPYGISKEEKEIKKKKQQNAKSLLNKTYNHPSEIPKNLYDYIRLNGNLLFNDATDAVRWSRIIDTEGEQRYQRGELTIFRATKSEYDEIRPGDWVTTDESYAIDHNERWFDGTGKVISMEVDGRDVLVSPTGNHEEAIYAPLEYSKSLNYYKRKLEEQKLRNIIKKLIKEEYNYNLEDSLDKHLLEKNVDNMLYILKNDYSKEYENVLFHVVNIYNLQDSNAERIISKHWNGKGGNVWRYKFENAGDILRELTKYKNIFLDISYIFEKIYKIEKFIEEFKNDDVHEDDKYSTLIKENKENLANLRKAYIELPILSEAQEEAKKLIISLIDGDLYAAGLRIKILEKYNTKEKMMKKNEYNLGSYYIKCKQNNINKKFIDIIEYYYKSYRLKTGFFQRKK